MPLLQLKPIQNSKLQQAVQKDSEKPYFNPTYIGSFAGQISGTAKAKDGDERVEVELESNVTVKGDIPGLANNVDMYVKSQKTHEKQDGTEYTLTTISVDKKVYTDVRDDLTARAILKMQKDINKLTRLLAQALGLEETEEVPVVADKAE